MLILLFFGFQEQYFDFICISNDPIFRNSILIDPGAEKSHIRISRIQKIGRWCQSHFQSHRAVKC